MTARGWSCVALVAIAGCGNNSTVNTGPPGADMSVAKVGDMAVAVVHDMAVAPGDMVSLGPCDPIKQDCADPANKCTTIADPNDPMMVKLLTQCVPLSGSVPLGGKCVRGGDGGATATAGHDDCDKGLFCSSDGTLVADFSQRHCRSFCKVDKDCKATPGGRCVVLVDMQEGLCSPTCTLFGTDCPMGLECSNLLTTYDDMNFVPTCRGLGKTAVGKSCMQATDCVAGATCLDPTGMQAPPVCVTLCDANHPCAVGQCAMAPGLDNMGGICK